MMKNTTLSLALTPLMLLAVPAIAQRGPQPPAPAQTNSVEDFKPSLVNQAGKQYPQVNSERRMRTSVSAPGATNVLLDIGGQRYPLTRREDGTWVGDSAPQDEGFHYYQIWVDSAQVPDPNSLYFFGASRWGSAIEIPASDMDFYALKNVPHGDLRKVYYFSKTSNSNRRCFVYTPPDYDADPTRRYPVLYLQHGMGEDETGWGSQGHAGLIMDNLIAGGKARPFIIVMENGLNTGGGMRRGEGPAGAGGTNNAARPRGGFNFAGAFERVLIDDLIPYIDSHYRTLTDQPHRAMAGLSMGGMQTRSIAPANLDKFSHIGVFSGGGIGTNDISDLATFKEKVRLVFISYGSRELGNRGGGGRGGFGGDPKASVESLKGAGINAVFYVSPDTAHEWQSWRRSLYQFAPLLFKD
jgi:enterochelin esterase family protein